MPATEPMLTIDPGDAGGDHPPRHEVAADEHASQVDVEYGVEVLDRLLVNGRDTVDAGVVDKQCDRPEHVLDRVDGALDRIRVLHLDLDRQRPLRAGGLDLVGDTDRVGG